MSASTAGTWPSARGPAARGATVDGADLRAVVVASRAPRTRRRYQPARRRPPGDLRRWARSRRTRGRCANRLGVELHGPAGPWHGYRLRRVPRHAVVLAVVDR